MRRYASKSVWDSIERQNKMTIAEIFKELDEKKQQQQDNKHDSV